MAIPGPLILAQGVKVRFPLAGEGAGGGFGFGMRFSERGGRRRVGGGGISAGVSVASPSASPILLTKILG